MKFRPCIDLHNGKVKQLVGSSLNDNSVKENYVSDLGAEYYAEMYKSDALTGGHVISLGSGNDREILKALRAYPGGLQVGGGINSDNANWYLENGASHVIVTSYIFTDGRLDKEKLMNIAAKVGKERLVIDLSCRKKNCSYFVAVNRWKDFTNFEITEDNLNFLSEFCDEFLIHAVDVEGMCNGIEVDLVRHLGSFVKIPCTYAGGISGKEDINQIKSLGKEKLDFTVGSALDIFGGKLKYSELIYFNT